MLLAPSMAARASSRVGYSMSAYPYLISLAICSWIPNSSLFLLGPFSSVPSARLWSGKATYLHIPRPPIQIQMQIFDLTKIRKLIRDILLAGLFMHICDNDDPSLDRADGRCAGESLEGCRVQGWCGGGGWDVDVHLCVGHVCGLIVRREGEVVVC